MPVEQRGKVKSRLGALRSRARQQSVVAELGVRALSGLPLDALMHEVVSRAAEVLKVRVCHILERTRDGALVLRAEAGRAAEGGSPRRVLPEPGSLPARALEGGQGVVVVDDLTCEPPFEGADWLVERGLVGGASVQIPGTEEPYGLLCVHDLPSCRFHGADRDFLQGLANVVAAAVMRSRSEEALLQSREHLAEAQRVARLGSWEWNIRTNVLWWSDEIYRLFGLPPQEFGATYEAFLERVHPEDRDQVSRAVDLSLAGKAPYAIDHRVVRPDGTEIRVHERAEVFRDDQGQALRMVGTVQDVTELRRLEQESREALRLKTLGQLARAAAHDFNDLLGALFVQGERLQEGLAEDDPLRSYADGVCAMVARGSDLINQLMAFSRLPEGGPTSLDLDRVVGNLWKPLQHLAQPHLDLEVRPAGEGPVWVDMNLADLEQILVQLVLSIRDAAPGGGTLALRTRREQVADPVEARRGAVRSLGTLAPGSYAAVEVFLDAENDEAHRLLGLGARGSNGLATAFGSILQAQGTVDLWQRDEEGPSLVIRLPLAPPQPREEALDEVPALRGGSETILVAEDQASLRTLIRRLLTRYGYRVLEARDGAEALSLAEKEEVDLLLTDLVMPGLSGAELAERFSHLHPDAGLILISGYLASQLGDEPELGGIAPRTAPRLQKPFTVATLVSTVRSVLDGSWAGMPAVEG